MTRRVLLIINGRPRVGKDTVTEIFRTFAEKQAVRHGFASSIDPVRDMLRKTGFPVDLKGPEERKLLSDVGDAVEDYNGYKSEHVIRSASTFFLGTYNALYLTHIREPEMIMRIRDHRWADYNVDCLTLLVDGDRGEVHHNRADAGVRNFIYDHMLLNSGTIEELRVQCYQIFAYLFGGTPKEG